MDRKKILLVFGGAWISAALLSWFLYANTQGPKTDKTVNVMAATHDMPAGTRLKKADMKVVKVAEKNLPKAAMLDEKSTLDRVLLFPVNANDVLSSTKLATLSGAEGLPAMIEAGKRAISVQVTDISGVAGLIQPRAHVDVLFTRPGTMAEAVTTTILQDVVVLSIGRVTEVSSQNVDTRAFRPLTTAATLLVTPEEARKLELAKNQGKISLALRNPLDHSAALDSAPTTSADLFGADYARAVTARRGSNVRDNRAWARLTGMEPQPQAPKPVVVEKKEPVKPRLIVDVYRGDKHVQETFQ